MKILFILCLIFSSASLPAADRILKPFLTDGCTKFVDGTPKRPGLWKHCCVDHDLRYWFGGLLTERDRADLTLKACVEKAAGPKWAEIIYSGVRAGHRSPVKDKTFWGWGWLPKRGDLVFSSEEELYIKSELRKLPMDPAVIEKFISSVFHEN